MRVEHDARLLVRLADRCIAAKGATLAAIATMASGKITRMRNTAMRMPHVRKRRCHFGVISFGLFALTIALSKESESSRPASTAQMKMSERVPLSVPAVSSQASHRVQGPRLSR